MKTSISVAVNPGCHRNLLWPRLVVRRGALARWDGRTVLGMPTCGMCSHATTFDLGLPRLMAGEGVDNRALAGLGNGGLLLRDMAFRFPPCRSSAARGELE